MAKITKKKLKSPKNPVIMKKVWRHVLLEIDYSDLDQMIEKHFDMEPGSWSCVPCWEQGNDTSKTVSITKSASDEHEESNLELARADGERSSYNPYNIKIRNSFGGPRLLMTLMCRDGVLEEGEYLVKISW